MINKIELPPYGLTLLPPWWCAILWAGKRVENRVQSVAGRIGKYRGPVAITSSKTRNAFDVAQELADIEQHISPRWTQHGPMVAWRVIQSLSGMIVAVADIVDVRANGAQPSDPWAVPGQWGIHLANVREVEPVPCTGGRGFFRFGACSSCGHPGAAETKTGPLCRKCKAETTFANLKKSMLTEVTRE